MNAAERIHCALHQHIYLSADGDRLRLVFDSPPSPELLEALGASKQQVLTEVKRLQRQWLERVAHALQKPADLLLEHGIIDKYDAQELWHTDPMLTVVTVKTGCEWHMAHS